MSRTIHGLTQQLTEWHYISSKARQDPFNEVQLDVLISHENGESWLVPAFWGGEQEWRVRFAAPKQGIYTAESKCSDTNDHRLHHVKTILHIDTYQGNNPLYVHGPLQVSDSRQYLEFEDGTPFFWFGDTWWMGLCDRLSWPEDFQRLTADRVEKGFSLIQLVAGLYPDMDSFDKRAKNEAGFPWKEDYSTINPAYFDMADLRIAWLVRSGLVPCILGSWGYYLFPLGKEKMKLHWRYLIARWGAYPVIWTLAGETAMPYYLSQNKEEEQQKLREGWTEIAKYIKLIDPYSRLLTAHSIHIARDQVTDDSVLDLNMLQTGHSGYESVKNTISTVKNELERIPTMPTIVSEINYEGILDSNFSDMQRLGFWSAMLSGAKGFTYGANGVWQVNCQGKPFGNSPNGSNWGNTPWEEAYKLDGGKQIGLAAKLLQKFEWWKFKTHPEWVSPSADQNYIDRPFCTGIPRKVRIIYCHKTRFSWFAKSDHILNLEKEVKYNAYFWNPRNAKIKNIGPVKTTKENIWKMPISPTSEDWVIVLET